MSLCEPTIYSLYFFSYAQQIHINKAQTFNFLYFNCEFQPKMSENSVQNAAALSTANQQIPNVQQQIQPTHAYAGQPPQFHIPTTTPSAVPQMAYYAPNQPQFAPTMGYYQMPTPYIPPQYVLPSMFNLNETFPNFDLFRRPSHGDSKLCGSGQL